MRKILSVTAFAVMSAVLLASTITPSVSAQSSGLGITPRKDITIQAGKTAEDELTVSNLDGSNPLDLTLQVLDFESRDETGTPSLRLDPNSPPTPWSLRPFFKAPESIRVEPGKSQNITYSITIPENQGAGSYYSAVRYVAASPETDGNLSVTASGATLIFVTVPGEAKQQLNLKKFGAYAGGFKALFTAAQPLELAYLLENKGNVAERPTGSIVIKNTFGKKVKTIKNANPKSSLALIGQTRRFQVCIEERPELTEAQTGIERQDPAVCEDPKLWPGRYTATLNALYGINGSNTHEIATVTSFWYLPVWFVAAVVGGVLFLSTFMYLLWHRIRGTKPATFFRR